MHVEVSFSMAAWHKLCRKARVGYRVVFPADGGEMQLWLELPELTQPVVLEVNEVLGTAKVNMALLHTVLKRLDFQGCWSVTMEGTHFKLSTPAIKEAHLPQNETVFNFLADYPTDRGEIRYVRRLFADELSAEVPAA